MLFNSQVHISRHLDKAKKIKIIKQIDTDDYYDLYVRFFFVFHRIFRIHYRIFITK